MEVRLGTQETISKSALPTLEPQLQRKKFDTKIFFRFLEYLANLSGVQMKCRRKVKISSLEVAPLRSGDRNRN